MLSYNHTCLAVMSLESALQKGKNYYLQMFSMECKHIEKDWSDIMINSVKKIVSDGLNVTEMFDLIRNNY